MVKIGNALRNEIEKVALSGKTLASYARKRETQNVLLDQAQRTLRGFRKASTRGESAKDLAYLRKDINEALKQSRAEMSTKPIRRKARSAGFSNKYAKENLIDAVNSTVYNRHPGMSID